jgi:hypothetical protein
LNLRGPTGNVRGFPAPKPLEPTKIIVQAKPLQSLQKTWWQLYAFALTPGRLALRLSNQGQPRVLCTSIPKSGTNLMLRALCLHPRLYRPLTRTVIDPSVDAHGPFGALLAGIGPGQVIATHLRYDEGRAAAIQQAGVRHVFVIRDPRDVAVSTVFYTLREQDHYLHQAFLEAGTLKKRLALAIRGEPFLGYQSAGERLAASAGWLQPPTHVVRFEDLVGAQGGGSAETQHAVLKGLFDYLGMPATDGVVANVAGALFSKNTRTFREGRIGQWREHFDDELRVLFKSVAGPELVRYGYERDDAW